MNTESPVLPPSPMPQARTWHYYAAAFVRLLDPNKQHPFYDSAVVRVATDTGSDITADQVVICTGAYQYSCA